jgi:predicted AAA+ superfamily ATPase
VGRLAQQDFIDNEVLLYYYFIMSENFWMSKWTKEQVKGILLEQASSFWQLDTGLVRDQLAAVESASSSPQAVIISGLRRVGKSTLLAQLAHTLGKDEFYYLNFEDERFLGFPVDEANSLHQVLIEVFGERKIFILDEIQNITGWERFVRRFMDMGFKFYITGSNASLLSRELGSKLTGRYIPIELFPFSFSEFIRFKGYQSPDIPPLTTLERANLERYLEQYLRQGGMPEQLKYPELPLHRTLYNDVLYRDIATRYQIVDVRALKELAYYLISNPASHISFNKLKKNLMLGSVNTVKNYIEYLENSWLIFIVNVFDYSVKRQQIAPKIIYYIDTGMVNSIGFQFSPNTGRLIENLVFLALRRITNNIYYYATDPGYEVDFYLPETRQLIQVTTQNINHSRTEEREIRALLSAMETLQIDEALILSESSQTPIQIDNKTIYIKAVSEWLGEIGG